MKEMQKKSVGAPKAARRILTGALCLIGIISVMAIIACVDNGGEESGKKGNFTITKWVRENGDFILSQNTANRGDKITLIPKPNAGYVFDRWELDPALDPEEQSPNSGVYEFSMPGRNAKVSVYFVPRSSTRYTIIKGTPENGDFTITIPGVEEEVSASVVRFAEGEGTEGGGDNPPPTEGGGDNPPPVVPAGPLAAAGDIITLSPLPAGDAYKFDSWDVTPAIAPVAGEGGIYTFVMPAQAVTINAKFVSDSTPAIKSGLLKVKKPAIGDSAPTPGDAITVVKPDNQDDKIETLTVTFNKTGGGNLFGNNKYGRKIAYQHEYLLKAKKGYKLSRTANFTVEGGEVNYKWIRDDYAELVVTFPRLPNWPGKNDLVDIANAAYAAGIVSDDPAVVDIDVVRNRRTWLGAIASSINQYATVNSADKAFDGTSYLMHGDATTVWQANGPEAPNPHWLAIDLGKEYDLKTVIITWSLGYEGDDRNKPCFDGMVNGEIQVATGDSRPANMVAANRGKKDSEEPGIDDEEKAKRIKGGWYGDEGWTKDVGKFEGGKNTGNRLDGLDMTKTPWITKIELKDGTKGRYLRIKQLDPFKAETGGVWTEWPRISMVEVYTEKLDGKLAGDGNLVVE